MTSTLKNLIVEYSDVQKYPTLTTICGENQPYVDEPNYRVISKVKTVVRMLGSCYKNYFIPKDIEELVEYKRHILQWVKP